MPPRGGVIILSRASGGEGCLACRAEFADHNARGFVLLFGDAWVFTAGDAWVAQRACGFLTVEGGLSRGGRWLHTTMAARCGGSMRHVERLFSASSRGGEYVLKLCAVPS